MLIYLQMEPKWSQNRIKSIQTNSTHSDHETSIFQYSGPTVGSGLPKPVIQAELSQTLVWDLNQPGSVV